MNDVYLYWLNYSKFFLIQTISLIIFQLKSIPPWEWITYLAESIAEAYSFTTVRGTQTHS